jgi:hypothetical protein
MLLLEDSDMEELLAGSASKRRRAASSSCAEADAVAEATTTGQSMATSDPGVATNTLPSSFTHRVTIDDLQMDHIRTAKRSRSAATLLQTGVTDTGILDGVRCTTVTLEAVPTTTITDGRGSINSKRLAPVQDDLHLDRKRLNKCTADFRGCRRRTYQCDDNVWPIVVTSQSETPDCIAASDAPT